MSNRRAKFPSTRVLRSDSRLIRKYLEQEDNPRLKRVTVRIRRDLFPDDNIMSGSSTKSLDNPGSVTKEDPPPVPSDITELETEAPKEHNRGGDHVRREITGDADFSVPQPET